MHGRFYTLREFAAKRKRSTRTILRWCDEPDGLEYTKAGRERLFTDEWWLDYLNRRKRQDNPVRRRGRQAERRPGSGP